MKNSFSLGALIRKNIADMAPYSSARDEYTSVGKGMIFLDANENPFDNGVNRYPDPQQKNLKKELAAQKNVSIKQILLGNGSDEVLDLIFRAFCEPGVDNIITLPPTYGMYKVLARINNIEEREVFLNRNYQPEVGDIMASVDPNTKIIFLCSPNNPTGNSFSEMTVMEILKKFPGLVVVDEAYIEFSKCPGYVERLKEFPNLIITHTLSKAYGMAGIRLGIAYASEEIIAVLNKIKPPYNVNALTQEMALEAVVNKQKVLDQVATILEQRELLVNECQELGFILNIFPSDANFILVKVDDAPKRYSQLLEKGIVTRDRSKQPLCENTLRFTVGTAEENTALLQALKELDVVQNL